MQALTPVSVPYSLALPAFLFQPSHLVGKVPNKTQPSFLFVVHLSPD